MKTIPRLALFAAAALGAAVFFSGCTTAQTARSTKSAHFYDMTVMKSSGPVDLSTRQMTRLREAVIEFVQSNGVLSNGAYYVEVKFKPLEGETEDGWIVVKLVERDTSDYEMIASFRGQMPYYYDPFYSRFGFASFGNYPFDSFDYAYDGGGYSPPRFHPREHRPNDNDNDDHRHGGGHDVAHNGGGTDHHPRSGGDHRPPEPRHWESGGGGSTASYSPPPSGSSGGSSYSPPSAPSPSHSEPVSRSGDVRDGVPVSEK